MTRVIVWLWKGGSLAPGSNSTAVTWKGLSQYFAKGTLVHRVWLWRRWSVGWARICFAIQRCRQARNKTCSVLCQPTGHLERPPGCSDQGDLGSELTRLLHLGIWLLQGERGKSRRGQKVKGIIIFLSFPPPSDTPSLPATQNSWDGTELSRL